MPAEKSRSFEEDYIRLTETFKALSVFDQFLRGLQRAFLATQGGYPVDLGPLYEELKDLPSRRNASPPESLEASMRDLQAKLDGASHRLRQVEAPTSPSHVRRHFERVHPGDARIPFYLLRFYLSHPETEDLSPAETDEDLVDKVDYLATVLAAGNPGRASEPAKPREEIRKLFEQVLVGATWPRVDDDLAPEIVKAFDELASRIAATEEFVELVGERGIEGLRTLKHRVARGLAHPDILAAAACCNLTVRSVFQRLYEKEADALRETAARIADIEDRLPGDVKVSATLARYRESQNEFDQQTSEGSIRWRQVLDLKYAAAEVLGTLGEFEPDTPQVKATPQVSHDTPPEGAGDSFWGPCLRRFLSSVAAAGATDAFVDESGLPADSRLEPWEWEVARQAIGNAPLSSSDRFVLRAAALRVRAENEIEAFRNRAGEKAPRELVSEARGTLTHAEELERTFAELAEKLPKAEDVDLRRRTRTRLRLQHATSGLWLVLDRP
jgi:hypothetical protein